MYQNYAGVR